MVFADFFDSLHSHGKQVKKKTSKGYLRQLTELLFARHKGFSAEDYYVLELYNKKEWNYLGAKHFDKINRFHNYRYTGVMPFNKWIFSLVCQSANIPIPSTIGMFHHSFGVTITGKPFSSCDHLEKELSEITDGVVLKPVSGAHGDNVIVIESFRDGKCFRTNGNSLALEDLFSELTLSDEYWLVQSRVIQHEKLSNFNPSSVNTVRVETFLEEGVVHILAAYLRLGVGNVEIDNTTGGGISAYIDIDTGSTGPAFELFGDKKHSFHPSSQTKIDGFIIPHWSKVLEATQSAHVVMPFPKYLSWDVAITEDGPVILEVNAYSPMNFYQKIGFDLKRSKLNKNIV